ncbi:RraA family protein [Paraburkholderia dipogonis]|uniref:RraA family protein n=1 Tax=Paraburkholderia dipogonis TaxID=1211383 RepID=UPI0038B96461
MSAGFSAELLDNARRLGSATLHEAGGKIGALPSSIKPLNAQWRIAAPAFTVAGPALDNLWLHRAIYAAPKGAVLLHECGAFAEAGYWGGVMANAALARDLAGFISEGGVRDVEELRALGFKVFAANICIRGTGKRADGAGALGGSVRIGDVLVTTGDLVVADADGVVVLPAQNAEKIVAAGMEREAKEKDIVARLKRGERSLDIYGLPENAQ